MLEIIRFSNVCLESLEQIISTLIGLWYNDIAQSNQSTYSPPKKKLKKNNEKKYKYSLFWFHFSFSSFIFSSVTESTDCYKIPQKFHIIHLSISHFFFFFALLFATNTMLFHTLLSLLSKHHETRTSRTQES